MTSVKDIAAHFELTDSQASTFEAMKGIYEKWNSQINVISRKDIDNFYVRHVLHSLAIAKFGGIEDGQKVLDLGCGGGFPVVPLSVLYPNTKFTAVDSVGKKIIVVRAVAEELSLTNITVHHCRVETLAENWDWVVSKAVAPLADLMNWTRGKYSKGMILLKGGDLDEEIKEAGFTPCKNFEYKNKLGQRVKVVNISEFYADEFFETKKIVIVLNKNA